MTRRRELAVRIAMGVLGALVLASGAIFALSVARSDLRDYADEKQAEEEAASYEKAVAATDTSRAGCVATNVLRQAQWNNAMIDAVTREAAAADLGSSGDQVRALAEKSRADAAALVEAVAEAPLKPGSPQRDCVRVYGAPELPEGVESIAQESLRPAPISPYHPPK